jgi:hypothetical protein
VRGQSKGRHVTDDLWNPTVNRIPNWLINLRDVLPQCNAVTARMKECCIAEQRAAFSSLQRHPHSPFPHCGHLAFCAGTILERNKRLTPPRVFIHQRNQRRIIIFFCVPRVHWCHRLRTSSNGTSFVLAFQPSRHL